MKKNAKNIALAVLFVAFAGGANAACFADYKAKRDKPLRLHYGVIKLSDGLCKDVKAADKLVATRLSQTKWQLLNVMSLFDDKGLKKRQDSAGDYFLRY
jgi:hypothetical protein